MVYYSAIRAAARCALLAVTLTGCGGLGETVIPPPVPARATSTDPFDETILHYVDLTVSPADLGRIVPGGKEYVGADLAFDDEVVTGVGIRIKGHSTLRPVDDKPSWAIKTNEFVKGQRLKGKKKILLHNCVLDPSFLAEHVSYDLWRRAGHPARRTGFARVTLNGRYLGVYVVAEPYDDGFLPANYQNGSGNLYEGAPGVDFSSYDRLELSTNDDVNDRRDAAALAKIILQEPDSTFAAGLTSRLDVEGFLTYWAVEALVGHWDGYAAQNEPPGTPTEGPNNWYAYCDPSTGKFDWLPHSADLCLRAPSMPVLAEPDRVAVLAYRSFREPALRARFEQRIRSILDHSWDTSSIQARIDAAVAMIHGSVAEGDASRTFSKGGFLPAVAGIRRFILDRPTRVRSELDH